MAGDINVKDFHVRHIEKEMGISLEGQEARVLDMLKGTGKYLKTDKDGKNIGVIGGEQGSATWTDEAYEAWGTAVSTRSRMDRANKFILNRQNVATRAGLIKPTGFVFKQTPVGKMLSMKERVKRYLRTARQKSGETVQRESESMPVLDTWMDLLHAQAVSNKAGSVFITSKKNTKSAVLDYIDDKYNVAIDDSERKLGSLIKENDRVSKFYIAKDVKNRYGKLRVHKDGDGNVIPVGQKGAYKDPKRDDRAAIAKFKKPYKQLSDAEKEALEKDLGDQLAKKRDVPDDGFDYKIKKWTEKEAKEGGRRVYTYKSEVKDGRKYQSIDDKLTASEIRLISSGRVIGENENIALLKSLQMKEENVLKDAYLTSQKAEQNYMKKKNAGVELREGVMQDPQKDLVQIEADIDVAKTIWYNTRKEVVKHEKQSLYGNIFEIASYKTQTSGTARDVWVNMMKQKRLKIEKLKIERKQNLVDYRDKELEIDILSKKLRDQRYRNPTEYSDYIMKLDDDMLTNISFQADAILNKDEALKAFHLLKEKGVLPTRTKFNQWKAKQQQPKQQRRDETRRTEEGGQKLVEPTGATPSPTTTAKTATENIAQQQHTAEQNWRESMGGAGDVMSGYYDPFFNAPLNVRTALVGSGVSLQVSGTDAMQEWQERLKVDTPLPTAQPSIQSGRTDSQGQSIATPETAFNPFGYDMVTPPPIGKLDPSQPMPNLMQNVKINMSDMQDQMRGLTNSTVIRTDASIKLDLSSRQLSDCLLYTSPSPRD